MRSRDTSRPRPAPAAGRPWQLSEAARRRLLATVASRAGAIGATPSRDPARREIDVDAAIAAAIREETAAAIGRAGRRLQAAIAALAACDSEADGGHLGNTDRSAGSDAGSGDAGSGDARERRDEQRRYLLAEAANALWECVVQREAMGLTDHQMIDRIYGVPPVLWRMMGARTDGY
ncbi:MAG: hypothetical protein AB7G13_11070 [Lautropia sp.]